MIPSAAAGGPTPLLCVWGCYASVHGGGELDLAALEERPAEALHIRGGNTQSEERGAPLHACSQTKDGAKALLRPAHPRSLLAVQRGLQPPS